MKTAKKTKEKWVGKQRRKEDETRTNSEDGKNNDRKNDKRVFENCF